MRLPGIGSEGQALLAASEAILVGCGALGCVLADHLARAGVGRLRLIDRDLVERSNLQRQSLFTEADADAARPKAHAAADRLVRVNSEVTIEPVAAHLDASNAGRLLSPSTDAAPTILLDGTDNFETRYLLNDAAVRANIAWIHAGVIARRGSAAAFVPGSACLRCLEPDPPAPGTIETCETAGVLAPAVGVAASIQASLAIDRLLGALDASNAPTISFDLATGRFARTLLAPLQDPACPCCAERSFPFLDAERAEPTLSLCGRDAVQILPPAGSPPPAPEDLAARFKNIASVEQSRLFTRATLPAETPGAIRDRADAQAGNNPPPIEFTIFRDGRTILRGIADPARARALYDRYLGA